MAGFAASCDEVAIAKRLNIFLSVGGCFRLYKSRRRSWQVSAEVFSILLRLPRSSFESIRETRSSG